jgi:hypothetical protein
MAVEVLIEPVDRGRYDSKTLAPGRIWSKEYGMLDVEDHMKKLKIEKEAEALKVRQEADRLRMQGNVKAERAEAARVKKVMVKERTDKMYKDVPEGMLVDPVTGANVPRKEESKELKPKK